MFPCLIMAFKKNVVLLNKILIVSVMPCVSHRPSERLHYHGISVVTRHNTILIELLCLTRYFNQGVV